MEVSQAIWLTLFLFNALLISPKRFDEIILDFYQDAGIWIVIASCVAEYLLLLTYIGVAAYDFFKNRKMMKKMNVQRRTYEFLKFDESHRDVGNRLTTHLKKTDQAASTQNKDGLRSETNGQTSKKHTPIGRARWNQIEMPAPRVGTPNNPQLLKFDGDHERPMKKTVEDSNLLDHSRRMNKSLKRKQIE